SRCLFLTSVSPASSAPVLQTPQPPPSTLLFPYTTLFRSIVAPQQVRWTLVRRSRRRVILGRVDDACLRAGELDPRQHVARRVQRDRKSTRLNSSHLVISYAVFCMKKNRRLMLLMVVFFIA